MCPSTLSWPCSLVWNFISHHWKSKKQKCAALGKPREIPRNPDVLRKICTGSYDHHDRRQRHGRSPKLKITTNLSTTYSEQRQVEHIVTVFLPQLLGQERIHVEERSWWTVLHSRLQKVCSCCAVDFAPCFSAASGRRAKMVTMKAAGTKRYKYSERPIYGCMFG